MRSVLGGGAGLSCPLAEGFSPMMATSESFDDPSGPTPLGCSLLIRGETDEDSIDLELAGLPEGCPNRTGDREASRPDLLLTDARYWGKVPSGPVGTTALLFCLSFISLCFCLILRSSSRLCFSCDVSMDVSDLSWGHPLAVVEGTGIAPAGGATTPGYPAAAPGSTGLSPPKGSGLAKLWCGEGGMGARSDPKPPNGGMPPPGVTGAGAVPEVAPGATPGAPGTPVGNAEGRGNGDRAESANIQNVNLYKYLC